MGCCLSTKKHPPSSKLHQHPPPPTSPPPPPPPPPPVVDVETVKEVYSEIPNPIKTELDDPKTYSISRHNSYKYHTLEHPSTTNNNNISTTSFDDDDNYVYRRKVVNQSPSKSTNRSHLSGELQHVRKSPVRGKELQSPGRVKLVPETGFGASERRSPARSRSPAKRTAVGGGGGGGGRSEIGRSLSGRRTGKSPGRVGSDLHERVRKPELRSGRGSDRFMSVDNKDESFENPLVSLECFIFL